MPGFWEILIITLIIFALFGAKKLPEIARSIGKGIHEFKKTKDEISEPLIDEDPLQAKEKKVEQEHKNTKK